MIWIQGITGLAIFLAVAYPVTFALTKLVVRLIDLLARFIPVPWRCRAEVQRPQDPHHSIVRFVLSLATLFFVALCTAFARERLGPIALISQSLFYGALLIALAEWLEGRSARLAAWVCFGGMALYAFFLGANVIGRATIPAIYDTLACIGFLVLALRAAREDDRARRSQVPDPGIVRST